MRAVVQRVSEASVSVNGETVGSIGKGILVLLGISKRDTDKDIRYVADKILDLRIFDDENGTMNLSAIDVAAELLVVSQFTLYGDTRRGRRPSYIDAAAPEDAKAVYERFVSVCRERCAKVETGVFQAMMDVSLVNDGPVTIIIDSEKII
jgi:D-tyrosyl-tRNA(Tyr) deacylase